MPPETPHEFNPDEAQKPISRRDWVKGAAAVAGSMASSAAFKHFADAKRLVVPDEKSDMTPVLGKEKMLF